MNQSRATELLEQEIEKLNNEELGNKIDAKNKEKMITLIALLGAHFGASQKEMMGDDNAGDECGRRGLARMMVSCWVPKSKGSGGRSLHPGSIVRAVQKARDKCRKFPSEGLLFDFAIGEHVAWYPGAFFDGEKDRQYLSSDSAIEGSVLAEKFQEESEREQYSPNRVPPRSVSQRRIRAIRALYDRYVVDQPVRKDTRLDNAKPKRKKPLPF